MKINKLDDEVFFDFASGVIGVNVELYKADLQMTRSDKGVKLKLYLGGEKEDERKLLFQDAKCVYVNQAHGESKKDVTYCWVNYLLHEVDELSDGDKQEIVNSYNNNLENEIKNYTSEKREQLIKL